MQGKTLGEGRVDRFRTEIKNIHMPPNCAWRAAASPPASPMRTCPERGVYTFSRWADPQLVYERSASPPRRRCCSAARSPRPPRLPSQVRRPAPRTRRPTHPAAHEKRAWLPRCGVGAEATGKAPKAASRGRPLIKREEHSDWKLERRTGVASPAAHVGLHHHISVRRQHWAARAGRKPSTKGTARQRGTDFVANGRWQTEGGEIAACRSLKGMASPMLA